MALQDRRTTSARRICAGRMQRLDEFPEEMFSDAAWGMLLLTYARKHDGLSTSTTELYGEGRLSPEIGRRWLTYLEQEGLVTVSSASGAERQVALTSSAEERLHRYLDGVIDLVEGGGDR